METKQETTMGKTNYLPYVGVFDVNRSALKQYGDSGLSDYEAEKYVFKTIDEIVRQMTAYDRQTAMQIEHLTLLDELCWRMDGRDMLFPSRGLVESLLSSKFDIDPEIFEVPFRVFSVSVPRDMRWKGSELRPFIVTYNNAVQRQAAYDKLYRRYGIDPIAIDSDQPETVCMRVTMTTPVVVNGEKRRAINRSSFTPDMMKDILSSATREGASPSEAMEIAGMMKKIRCSSLTESERNEMYWVYKLAVGLSLFIQSFPKSMVDGLPKDYTVSTGKLPKGVRPKTVGKEIMSTDERRGSGSVGPHYCGMYFRSYPMRKNGTREPGIVKVEPYWTGGKVTPHTVGQETVGAS
jgi:hypothetical protein